MKATFRDGTSINELAIGLQSGRISPHDVPPIRIFERQGIFFTLDLWSLISWELPEPFQTLHLARVLNRPRWFAQKAAYCLREFGASTVIGKAGNALVYSRTPSDGIRPHISSGALSGVLVPYPTECATSTDARRTE